MKIPEEFWILVGFGLTIFGFLGGMALIIMAGGFK